MTSLVGSADAAVRILAAGALVYLLGVSAVLFPRIHRDDIAMTDIGAPRLDLGPAHRADDDRRHRPGSTAAFELMLIMFLARPMLAFLFVLASFDADLRTPGRPR